MNGGSNKEEEEEQEEIADEQQHRRLKDDDDNNSKNNNDDDDDSSDAITTTNTITTSPFILPYVYTGHNESEEIPDEVQHVFVQYGVKCIHEEAFLDKKHLMSVFISSSVEIIGESAFAGCEHLKTVRFLQDGKSRLKQINDFAFDDCCVLNEILLPQSIKHIGRDSFNDCKGLQNIMLPEGLEEIKNCGFWRCSSLKEIKIPSSIECIGESAFAYCDNLENVKFEGRPGTAQLYQNIFYSCPKLKSIIFPAKTTPTTNNTYENDVSIPRFSFRSIRYYRETSDGPVVKVGFEPVEINNLVDVSNNLPPQPSPPEPEPRFDNFKHYKSLLSDDSLLRHSFNTRSTEYTSCNSDASNADNENGRIIGIKSIRMISRRDENEYRLCSLCGFKVTYCGEETGEPKIKKPKKGDNDSWVLDLKEDEFLVGLRPFIKHFDDNEKAKITGVTFVTNRRQVHWGERYGYFEPYRLMVDESANPTVSAQSRIVALAATYNKECGRITGLGCYSRRSNWFCLGVEGRECVRLRWLFQKGRAMDYDRHDDEGSDDVVVNLLIKLHEDGLFREFPDDGIFSDNVYINLLMKLQAEDLFRKIIKFLI